MSDFEKTLRAQTALPLLAASTIEEGVALAEVLAANGLPLIEVALRGENAMAILRAIVKAVPTAHIGAGTVLNEQQFKQAADAGARFFVSPGATSTLYEAAAEQKAPWIPGTATVSEIMALHERGIRLMKFFPAENAGGAAFLKAVAPVVPDVSFMPTGGINAANAEAYLALPNVAALGGSWMVPAHLVKANKLDRIAELVKEAARLNAAKRADNAA